MGAVYRALDRQTGAIAALKVVHEDETPTDHHERLVREARLLAELQHPAIVRYLAFGATDKGWPFLAMEWLEGEDLAVRLHADGVDPSESIAIAIRVAQALGAAHERGIVHRDIKPSNIYLVGGDPTRVKVLDFGVARFQLADDGVTRTGAAVGTPRYMSPEQARGSRDVDVRADVFALGCVLFECLAGRPAFAGANQGAVLAKILLEDAPKLSSVREDLPPALEQLLARMLSKHRDDRPADGHAVAAELAALGDLGATTRRPAGPRDAGVTTGEQRLVCVVFAETALEVTPGYDQTPSTPSTSYDWPSMPVLPDLETQTIDPRRPVRPTHQVVRKLETIVAEHQGRAEVLKDGSVVVTLFGRGAATDQAASAARCALALRRIFPNTAMALAIGRSAATDNVTLGELIDRATAVLSRPPPESAKTGMFPIYVDDVSAALLDLRFSIDGDIHGLFVSRERDVAVAARTLLGRPTSCVGRERELALLLATFEECIAEPMAHVVLLTSGAGIGKSRVRFELMQRLAQTGRPFEAWIGRGDPMSAGTPFAMLAQALRRAARVVDDEPASVRYRKLRARVMRNVSARDAEHVTEFLAELLGAAPPGEEGSVQLRAARQDPQLMGDQMLRACQQFFEAECAVNPVVLVLEDLQWSDRATVQFVDAIVRQLAERPLFVLALARPEVDVVFPRLWSERRVERLQLRELTKKASEKLVTETLGADVEPELLNRLVERAAGNAFYLEELIRSVAEGHRDRLPETVVAMVQARIEALELEARHVLRAASIFGQVFWRGGVEALLDGGDTQVDDWLDELARRELITVRRDSRFGGEVEYTFRHALVREAAYAMLTDRDRMAGHRLAGSWLEARAGGKDVEAVALAEHFMRGGEPARAVTWFRHAAQQALEGDDLAGAIGCADRAIACVNEADQSSSAMHRELIGVLRQLQAGAHNWRGEFALAAERGNEALALLSPESVPWLVAAAAVADASSSRRLEHARVLDLCRTLAATSVTPALHHAYAHAVAKTMTTVLWHGDAALVEQLFGKLVQIEAADSDPGTRAWIYYARAWRALHAGDNVAALALDQKVEHCFTEVGDLRQACRQHASVGYGQLMLGANAEAERSLRESIAIAKRIGLHQVTAQAQQNLGIALARLGRTDEAREVERAALAAFKAQDNPRQIAFAHNYLAEIELAAGNADAALTYAREALVIDSQEPGFHCVYRARMASAHLLAGNLTAALDESTQATQLMEAHGRPEEGEMLVRLSYARALHATGDTAKAREMIADIEQRVMAAAAQVNDEALRRSLLEGVPEHALALSLVRQWGVTAASART